MKHLIAIIIAASFIPLVEAAPPTTREALVDAVKQAVTQKDGAALERLTYSVGMTDSDKQMAATARQHLMDGKEIAAIGTVPLPSDFEAVFVGRGKKFELNCTPKGLIQIMYKPAGSGASSSFPYAEVDGGYYIAGGKMTTLDWKGPEDRQIGFVVAGPGQDSMKVRVKWNASGIPQERTFAVHSVTLIGQHIESVVVTSVQENAALTLTVSEGGKDIYESEPLKGKGSIEYTRK